MHKPAIETAILVGASRFSVKDFVGDLLASLVLFPVSATYLLSYTALVYAGPLAFGRPAGLAAMLIATVAAGLVTGLSSSFRFAYGTLDNNATAIMATIAAAISGEMGAADPDSLLATVIAGMAIAGIVAGATLLALGCVRAGAIVRLIPLQVMAGFLGTTGWILASGGIRVGAGHKPTLEMLFDRDVDYRLVAVAGIAAAFGFLSPRIKSPKVLPMLIGFFILAHHAVFGALGVGLPAQHASGWLIAFPGELPVTIPWNPASFARIDWTVLSHHGLALVVLAAVSPISLLLTATGLETATRREADIDRELRVGGFSSLLSGAAGGTISFMTFARSLALEEAGARSRLAPVATALLMGITPFAFPTILGLIPVTVLGGLLFYLGCGLLHKWVYETKAKMSLGEWIAIPAVIALSIQFGVISGICAGLLIGCVNFAMTYGHSPPVRAGYFGDVAISNVSRSFADSRIVGETARDRLVLYLQGYLFFGTANRLLAEIQAEIAKAAGLRRLVLDFGDVDGLDSSALSSFHRLFEIAAEKAIAVIFVAAPEEIAKRLREIHPALPGVPTVVRSLDEALEWCEEQSLAESGDRRTEPEPLSETLEAEFGDAAMARTFLDHFALVDVPPGTILMEQGDASDDLAFIEKGRASVIVRFGDKPPMRVRTILAGTMVGELGFYIDTPRTATIRAETECRILRITKADIRRLEDTDPRVSLEFHRLIAKRLCRRIRDKDHLIAGLVRSMKRPVV